ncbi:transposase [Hymenobacter sp. UYCo722]|uniref:transposase n=1 Tax=Hymenobacter sp. UYCo722 TaxID=3156335 RepID=UPI0033986080
MADNGYDTGSGQPSAPESSFSASKNRPQRRIDRDLHRDRTKVERFFSRLRQSHHLAIRYDKLASSFLGLLHFISALFWLR